MNAVSDEQQHIINKVKEGKNVIVDACAGSGKSTTILSAAKALPHLKFLLITYNKSLRKEVKEKVAEIELLNVVVHTYHSLAVAVYNELAHVDKVMRMIVTNNDAPKITLYPYDIIVLDEVQDMTFLYFRLILKYIMDIGKPVQMMILGDYMQGLYEFKGADIRFLTMALQIWSGFGLLKSEEFVPCQLKTSYRITNQMADFVNHVMLGETRLYACRDGEPVIYIRRKIHDIQKIVVNTIKELIQDHNATPSDIFVLGGSVKGPNSHIRNIENALVEAGIPCHVPMMENADNFDENVIKGKVVFSSFHTSKGRQRPYVFVVGFDHSYFKIVARTLDPLICPNTLYVATTRASQRLYLLESDNFASDRPLKFLKQTHNVMRTSPYIDFRGIPQSIFEEDSVGPNTMTRSNDITIHKTTPTDMTKFVPETVLEEITQILDQIFIKESNTKDDGMCVDEIQLPTVLRTLEGHYEDVSDLNGIAIPSMLYDYILALYDNDADDSDTDSNKDGCENACGDSKNSILYDMIVKSISQTKPNKHTYLKETIRNLNPVCSTVSDYLYMANVYQSVEEKLYFKLKQIKRDEYTWLSPAILLQCKQRMMHVLGEEIMQGAPKIEDTIITYLDEGEHIAINQCLAAYFPSNEQFQFSARIDLMTESTLWELKCTSEISTEHMIQTVIYAWIMRTIHPGFSRQVKIFNIRTGQIMRLDADKYMLDKVVVALLKGKYRKQEPLTDSEFIASCRQYIV